MLKVYTLDTSSWRETDQVPWYPESGRSVFANGGLHWFADLKLPCLDKREGMIVSFGVGDESFNLIHPPNLESDICFWMLHLVDLRGSLAMTQIKLIFCQFIDICVLEDYASQKWVKEHRISTYCACGFNARD